MNDTNVDGSGATLNHKLHVWPELTADSHQWRCPTHPGVVRNRPGSCPICGVALERVEVGSEDA